jgi:hypothetical protein
VIQEKRAIAHDGAAYVIWEKKKERKKEQVMTEMWGRREGVGSFSSPEIDGMR